MKSPPTPSSSPLANSADSNKPRILGAQDWTTIRMEESVHELQFSPAGELRFQNKILLNKIPVSYRSDGVVTTAQRLIVSDSSPTGNFSIVKACESAAEDTGLCWAVFLVDRAKGTAKQITVGKYGGQNWVQWSKTERYAVLVEQMEGVFRFVGLDLQTGDSKPFDEMYPRAELDSFSWIDDRTFQVKVSNCEPFNQKSNCQEAPIWYRKTIDLDAAVA